MKHGTTITVAATATATIARTVPRTRSEEDRKTQSAVRTPPMANYKQHVIPTDCSNKSCVDADSRNPDARPRLMMMTITVTACFPHAKQLVTAYIQPNLDVYVPALVVSHICIRACMNLGIIQTHYTFTTNSNPDPRTRSPKP